MIRQYEPQGGVGEADAVEPPEDPTAQNAATQALKPKAPMPTSEAMPQIGPSQSTQVGTAGAETNPDPNAYAPPPQQNQQATETAVAATSGVQATPNPTLPQIAPATTQSFIDPVTGQPTQGTAPAGVPAYESAPLIASAAGGTMTPQGDSANSFRGYVSPQGGGFGGAFAEKGADAPLWSSVSNGDPQAITSVLGNASADPALKQAAADQLSRWLTMNDTQGNAQQIINTLSPEAKALVEKTYTTGAGGFAADQAGYSANRVNQGDLYKQSWSRLAGSDYNKQQMSDKVLAATFIPGVGSARVEGDSGNIVNPNTQQVIGNINDPNLDLANLKAAMGATGNFTMSANGQAVPTGSLPQPGPVQAPNAGNWTPATAPAIQPATPPATTGGAVATPQKVQTTTVPTVTPPATGGAAPTLPGAGVSGVPSSQVGGYQAGMGNVAQNPTTAQNTLTNQTISRAPGADRYKQAMEQWDAWQKATNPAYEASTRDAMRKAAAGGALGSGMLQTSLGDLAQQRQLAMDTQKQNFLSQALTGTIDDAFKDLGIATQQQGFQKNQQDTAFNNAIQSATLQEMLQNGGFQRALQALTAGSSQNPADTALLLSQIFGGQAGQASGSLGALFSALGQRSGSGGTGGSTGSTGNNTNLLSTILQYAPNLFGGGAPTTGLPTGQSINGGSNSGSSGNQFSVGYRP